MSLLFPRKHRSDQNRIFMVDMKSTEIKLLIEPSMSRCHTSSMSTESESLLFDANQLARLTVLTDRNRDLSA